ncbi:hypothetical protein P7K49_009427 [Saguinus oedipus]|uniref:Uncharacterized protein n=1 Tax=Saguinus oedipus TaxID=9490 RepID=A0ABQ9VJX8_SAGOE|nr:hypothetical protein P7K49_009427 [Saguinus oedipus]
METRMRGSPWAGEGEAVKSLTEDGLAATQLEKVTQPLTFLTSGGWVVLATRKGLSCEAGVSPTCNFRRPSSVEGMSASQKLELRGPYGSTESTLPWRTVMDPEAEQGMLRGRVDFQLGAVSEPSSAVMPSNNSCLGCPDAL